MRLRSIFAALAAALTLSSCSDDPAGPGGAPVATRYQASIDFFRSPIVSLWGQRTGDVYASGLSIMRFDGEAWSALVLPEDDSGYLRTWGTENGDIFALGMYGIHHYDGHTWERMQRPAQVSDVWGSENGEIFVVGGNHRLYHYDGADWFVDSLMTNYEWGDPWRRVSGGDPDDVYIVGASGWLGHYDGVDWSAQRIGARDFEDCWKAPAGPLFVLSNDSLFMYEDAQFAHVDLGASTRARVVCGRSANEVYCCVRDLSNDNKVLRYDGHDWQETFDPDGQIDLMWGDLETDRLAAAGDGTVWVKGATPEQSLGNSYFDAGFFDLWGSEEGAIYAIGSKAYRYFDNTWTDLKKQDLTSEEALSIWGRSEEEIYAVGRAMILHYNGKAWTWVSGGGQVYLNAVGGSDDEVFAVGYAGAIVRYDGQTWSRMESGTTNELFGVYAWRGGAFAVGETGTVMRYDGRAWRPFPSPVGWTILDIFGFGANDIYAVGRGTTEMCHFDGRSWTPIFIGYTGGYNYSIWGTSGRNIFIGQGSGKVIHFDGSNWSPLPRVTMSTVTAVWGAPGGEIVSATRGGIVRYQR